MSRDEGPEQGQPDCSFEWAVEAEGSGGRGGEGGGERFIALI